MKSQLLLGKVFANYTKVNSECEIALKLQKGITNKSELSRLLGKAFDNPVVSIRKIRRISRTTRRIAISPGLNKNYTTKERYKDYFIFIIRFKNLLLDKSKFDSTIIEDQTKTESDSK